MDLSIDIVVKYHLIKNMKIEKDFLDNITKEQKMIDVKQTAYNFATYKQRTEFQVIKKLKEKNFSQEHIYAGLEFLKEFNLLNDEKYADVFVKEYTQRKNCGKNKTFLELRKRGIRKELAELTVKNYFDNVDSLELAKISTEKKLKLISAKPQEKQKLLLISHLQRQGFDWDTIKQILSQYL